MKKSLLSKERVRLLCAAMIFLVPGCRSTPVAPPGAPEALPESQKTEPSATRMPSETAKSPEVPPASASKPQKEIIERLLPDSLIAAPAKDSASRRVEYNTKLNNRPGASPRNSSWRYRSTHLGQIVGFEFSNPGGNRILPPRRDAVKNQFFGRDFQFRFDDRTRQDIQPTSASCVTSAD